MNKITIIGAGSVGSTIAYALTITGIASNIVMIDINKNKVEGEVMDIIQGTYFRNPISIVAATQRVVHSPKQHSFGSVIYNAKEDKYPTIQTEEDLRIDLSCGWIFHK